MTCFLVSDLVSLYVHVDSRSNTVQGTEPVYDTAYAAVLELNLGGYKQLRALTKLG